MGLWFSLGVRYEASTFTSAEANAAAASPLVIVASSPMTFLGASAEPMFASRSVAAVCASYLTLTSDAACVAISKVLPNVMPIHWPSWKISSCWSGIRLVAADLASLSLGQVSCVRTLKPLAFSAAEVSMAAIMPRAMALVRPTA